ncbi:hypothetical protein [Sulfitobacter sp. CS16]|uniref:hypothetical protein n=1 Tax=Sulfitobacter sp. CS16 TaxID=3368573 RepID=UPI0037452C56
MLRIISAVAVVCAYTPASASDWEDCNERMDAYRKAEVTGPNPIDLMLNFAADIGYYDIGSEEARNRASKAHDETVDQIVELSDSIEAFCASLKE